MNAKTAITLLVILTIAALLSGLLLWARYSLPVAIFVLVLGLTIPAVTSVWCGWRIGSRENS